MSLKIRNCFINSLACVVGAAVQRQARKLLTAGRHLAAAAATERGGRPRLPIQRGERERELLGPKGFVNSLATHLRWSSHCLSTHIRWRYRCHSTIEIKRTDHPEWCRVDVALSTGQHRADNQTLGKNTHRVDPLTSRSLLVEESISKLWFGQTTAN